MLDEHEAHARIGWERAQQLLKGFESPGRGAYANDWERWVKGFFRGRRLFRDAGATSGRGLRNIHCRLFCVAFFHAAVSGCPVRTGWDEDPLNASSDAMLPSSACNVVHARTNANKSYRLQATPFRRAGRVGNSSRFKCYDAELREG